MKNLLVLLVVGLIAIGCSGSSEEASNGATNGAPTSAPQAGAPKDGPALD